MDIFIKAGAFAMLCTVLSLVLSNNRKDISTLLSIAAVCILAVIALGYLEHVFDFFDSLAAKAGFDKQLLQILLKTAGISILSDFCTMICTDAGNGAMAKALQMLSCSIVLWISLPLFRNLLDLVSKLLENV